jgi:hypothetical protein
VSATHHIVEPAKVIAGLLNFSSSALDLAAADKTGIRTAAALDRQFDEAEQLVPHVLAHQQSADFPLPARQLTLKAFDYWPCTRSCIFVFEKSYLTNSNSFRRSASSSASAAAGPHVNRTRLEGLIENQPSARPIDRRSARRWTGREDYQIYRHAGRVTRDDGYIGVIGYRRCVRLAAIAMRRSRKHFALICGLDRASHRGRVRL